MREQTQLILKPIDNRGARGVLILDSRIDLAWAYQHSQSFSQSPILLAEEYLLGPQLSTETLIIEGQAYTVGVSDMDSTVVF